MGSFQEVDSPECLTGHSTYTQHELFTYLHACHLNTTQYTMNYDKTSGTHKPIHLKQEQ